MSPVLIFAPWYDGSGLEESERRRAEALENSRYIARQTAKLLESAIILEDNEAVREKLEATCGLHEFSGVLCCGHGEKHAVFGADTREAFDRHNIACIRASWVHLIACNAGCDLVRHHAVDHRALFVGYTSYIVVDFAIKGLPAELEALLIELVTCTTLALASGERDTSRLRLRAEPARQAMINWIYLNGYEHQYFSLEWLAQTLVERLITNR